MLKRIGLFFLLIILLLIGSRERYFFPNPTIDTHFAPGFSQDKFDQIEIGMTKDEVVDLVGEPLNDYSHGGWAYSRDGASPIGDFAWLVRAVNFDGQGKVMEINQFVAND